MAVNWSSRGPERTRAGETVASESGRASELETAEQPNAKGSLHLWVITEPTHTKARKQGSKEARKRNSRALDKAGARVAGQRRL